MSPRTPLPPPPPPAELRSWPDRDALLADRARALDELGRRLLGGGRLALFLLWFLLLELGWSLIGVLIIALGLPLVDPFSVVFGVVTTALGIGILVPAVWLTVRSLRQDRTVRERLAQWAALDRHGPTDARLRAPALSACWFLLSSLLCGLGLWTGFAVPAGATHEDGYGLVVYGMGAALILWITGLTGLAKAVGHYRLAVRLSPRPR
ncbi:MULTISPECIES: hypothetical protein [unclassified Streptomyces]|uniref:hypothetical protein n=1 Tax=unclassified Streptomyces TaxID=2593676 RepID=UPI0016612D0E|nr:MULTISPECIES: hypothetical protein [unclassified Streptomyces]MBD0710080.1 hypothetical protein [Streptomyces sp. CBMA291]MBD0715629.1 hypothetical protein [Streptomyces sp. CBMA370]